jgi:hypothetical protein
MSATVGVARLELHAVGAAIPIRFRGCALLGLGYMFRAGFLACLLPALQMSLQPSFQQLGFVTSQTTVSQPSGHHRRYLTGSPSCRNSPTAAALGFVVKREAGDYVVAVHDK